MADMRTWDGYPAVKMPDGSYATRITATVTVPELNNGAPTNIPTLWEGRPLSERESVLRALASNKKWPSYGSIEDAVAEAKRVSNSLGAAMKRTSLAEIRKQYPMYEDMSDDQFARAFHAKHYSDLDFKDFSKRVGYLKGADPSEYDPESPEFREKYGAQSKSTLDNLRAGIGKGMVDTVRGVGQLVGLVSRDDIAESRRLDRDLMSTGAGKAGNVIGIMGAAAPTMLIPGANTLTGAALIGGGLGLAAPSTSTKETLTNTVMGGVLSPAAMLAGRGIVGLGRGAKSALIDPFTKAGQERIAARTFQGFAGGADEAAKAAQSIQQNLDNVLPGVKPTTAELANNAGLAQLERTLKNNPEYITAFADRAASNRNAIMGAVDNIAGDDLARQAAVTARGEGTKELYQQATRALYTVDDELDDLLARPAVKQALGRAETLAANQGRPFAFNVAANDTMKGAGVAGKASRQVTGQGLQDLKMAMDEMLTDQTSGFAGASGNTLKNLRGQLLDWMERANPDFKAARTTYASMSKPINQMDVGQALRDRLFPALTDFGAETRLRPQAFAQAMRQGDATAANVLGRSQASITDILSPEQMRSLTQVGEQLARRVNADELGRAVGSNTGQNIVGQNVMRQFLGPLGLPESATERAASGPLLQGLLGAPAKIAEKVTGTIGEPNVLRKLVELGLSPEEAMKVLQAQIAQGQGVLKYQGAVAPMVSGANAASQ
jgi:hypothetical protein